MVDHHCQQVADLVVDEVWQLTGGDQVASCYNYVPMSCEDKTEIDVVGINDDNMYALVIATSKRNQNNIIYL